MKSEKRELFGRKLIYVNCWSRSYSLITYHNKTQCILSKRKKIREEERRKIIKEMKREKHVEAKLHDE